MRVRILVCHVLIQLLLVGMVFRPAAAQEETVPFDIPAQELASALDAFAEQAQVQMLYKAETVEGMQTRSLRGLWTRDQALRQIWSALAEAAGSDGSSASLFPRRA